MTVIQTINQLSVDEFVRQFENVFEHSPWVAQAIVNYRPFASVEQMVNIMGDIVQQADIEKKLVLIRSHPELGYDKIRLTTESQNEQNRAKLRNLTDQERKKLIELNEAYKNKFNFPFVVCVTNHNNYTAIIHALETRLQSSSEQEIDTAINEIIQIASYRVQNIILNLESNLQLSLSTHILDLVSGSPAPNVKIALYYNEILIFEGKTNHDGRCNISNLTDPLKPGSYQFAFYISDYFKKQDYPTTNPPFLDVIRVDFGLAKGKLHYHVPLLVSPYGFSTYRGS
ncbi:5-hydroxyisourate hydrolase (purine catabolism) [Commensalibacter communis]|uniref:2-oxo-4-hydroxy-4-carboxy-5-ureidoimidazoline decarboxylase n=1 Tax=Commensalibacter communis TaxID=2972786 RepID=UPI0022FF5450|nr:5-hydroxyisourate hydrolase (purine catabolism) [Commensalibacter communis]